MMFPINQAALPVLQTRKALIVIDLQKGLIDGAGCVPTRNPPKLVQNVEALVPVFRQTGTIIWCVMRSSLGWAIFRGIWTRLTL